MTLPPNAEQVRADLRLRGVRLFVDGADLVVRGSIMSDDVESLRARKAELMAYLSGPGERNKRGHLDARYGLDLDDYGLTPPSPELPELRMRYFAWPHDKREKFNRLANERSITQGRVAAERMVGDEMGIGDAESPIT